MEKLTELRNLIERVLKEYERLYNLQPRPGVESFVIFDEERGNYLLVCLGWAQNRRVRRTAIFVRLRNGKIWIEEDWTEEGIATELVRAGVPREDIVLAFHSRDTRPMTEFAVS
jgi:hypothetical protein